MAGKKGARKILIDREEFTKAYLDDLLTYDEMAKKFHCGTSVISYRVKEWGLKRTPEQRGISISKAKTIYHIDREEFEKAFLEENLTLVQMAERFNTTFDVVRHKLKDWGIKKPKSLSIANARHPRLPIGKEELYDLYINKGLTVFDIAERFHCHYSTISVYLKNYGIKRTVEQVVARRKETCREKYGVEDASRIGWPEGTEEIITNKEKLTELIFSLKYKTTINIAKELGCSPIKVNRAIREFGLEHMIDAYVSYGEQWIDELLESLGVFHYKTRQIIYPYEIDFYCPDYGIGIEFNGDYWHSVEQHGTKYHLKKYEMAKKKDIFLIHIYEHEWVDFEGREKIEFFLRNFFSPSRDSFLEKIVLNSENDGVFEQKLGRIPDYIYEKLGLVKVSQLPPGPIPETERGWVVYDCGSQLWTKNTNKEGDSHAD